MWIWRFARWAGRALPERSTQRCFHGAERLHRCGACSTVPQVRSCRCMVPEAPARVPALHAKACATSGDRSADRSADRFGSGHHAMDLNPAHIVTVTDFSPETLRNIVAHLEVSTDFEHL